LIYFCFICVSNNQKLQRLIAQRWQIFQTYNSTEEPIMNYAQTQKNYGLNNTYRSFLFDNIDKDNFFGEFFLERFEDEKENLSRRMPMDDLVSLSRISMDFETATLKIMMSRYFRGRTRFKMAVRFVISQVGFDFFCC
jgi:hypothetical protein